MKTIIKTFLMVAILAPIWLNAQSKNVFLERDFWNSNPSITVIKQKIAEGNDPVALNNAGFNGVTMAILSNMPYKTTKYLVDLKSNDINTITHDGRTYLHWAAMKDLNITKYLVKKGLKTTDVDSHGLTVLTFAAATGQKNPEMYDFLLANGSSLSEKSHSGANVLLLLTPHLENMEMVDYFTSKGLSLNYKDEDGNGIFYYTAKTGNITMMDQLISKGVDYKRYNKVGGNAMIAAAQGRRGGSNGVEVFEYLEEKGIEPNVTTNDGTTPLVLLARSTRDTETLAYFISKGVDINQADNLGNTPLLNAARNDLKIIKFIAEYNINASNEDGKTPLLEAISRNRPEVVSYLISQGANVNNTDKDGYNAAFYLVKGFNPRDQQAFENKLEILIANGIDLNAKSTKGNTLFHVAAEKNDLYLLKKMHELGLDVNATDNVGTTPLQIAAMKATNDEILKYLLSIGADQTVKTDFDETVYDLAQENEALQRAEIDIEFLR